MKNKSSSTKGCRPTKGQIKQVSMYLESLNTRLLHYITRNLGRRRLQEFLCSGGVFEEDVKLLIDKHSSHCIPVSGEKETEEDPLNLSPDERGEYEIYLAQKRMEKAKRTLKGGFSTLLPDDGE